MAFNIFDDKTQYMKGYKIQIFPTESQAKILDARFDLNIAIYNWTIEKEIEQYDLYKAKKSDKKFLSYFDMIRLFTDFRAKNPWVLEMPYGSGTESIHRAVNAFEMFFKGKGNFPKFKSKKHLRKMSYGVRYDTMYFNNNMLRIEGFPRGEMIYTKWNSGFTWHYKDPNKPTFYSPVISKDNFGRYFISFSLLENKRPVNYEPGYSNPIGIDLNVRDRFVCSNGYRSGSPNLTKLKRLKSRADEYVQRDIKRRENEARTKSQEFSSIERSKRATKRLNRLRKVNDKLSNVVENFIQHETNTILAMKPTVIVMESLSVTDMEKNRKVSRQMHHSNFSRCITVMKNKCNQRNIPFISADKKFASSQICSNCGSRRKIHSVKTYRCPVCGLVIDRDLNASINLMKLAL